MHRLMIKKRRAEIIPPFLFLQIEITQPAYFHLVLLEAVSKTGSYINEVPVFDIAKCKHIAYIREYRKIFLDLVVNAAANASNETALLVIHYAVFVRYQQTAVGIETAPAQAADYERAAMALEAIKAQKNLTVEQSMAVHESEAALEMRLIMAMQNGDPKAKQAYEQLKRRRRN